MLQPVRDARMDAREQWVRAWPRFPALREAYLALCREAVGTPLALGREGALLSREADAVGIFLEEDDMDGLAAPGAAVTLLLAPFGAMNRLSGGLPWAGRFAGAFRRLVPGGVFAFDLVSVPEEPDALPRLVADGDAGDGRRRLLWETWRRTAGLSGARLSLGVEELAGGGVVAETRYLEDTYAARGSGEVRAAALAAGFSSDENLLHGGGRWWALRRKADAP